MTTTQPDPGPEATETWDQDGQRWRRCLSASDPDGVDSWTDENWSYLYNWVGLTANHGPMTFTGHQGRKPGPSGPGGPVRPACMSP